MTDTEFESDTAYTIEEIQLMIDTDLDIDDSTPGAVIVARNAPEMGQRYLASYPHTPPAHGPAGHWQDIRNRKYLSE